MTAKELGQQPAFPVPPDVQVSNWASKCKFTGLTKREWLAGLAMQGIAYKSLFEDQSLEDEFLKAGNKQEDFEKFCAELWVSAADALLEQLAKEQK